MSTNSLLASAQVERVRCRAHSKSQVDPETGKLKQCRNKALPGGFVCHFHGGKAPQVLARAEARLRQMVDPMIDRLYTLAMQTDDPSVAAICTRDALDRAGIGELIKSKVRASIRSNGAGSDRVVVNIGFLGAKPDTVAVQSRVETAPLALDAALVDEDDEDEEIF